MGKNLIKLPQYLKEHPKTVISDFDSNPQINNQVVRDLKKSDQYGIYTASDFIGYVWWDKNKIKWFCEIYKNHLHINTVQEKTIGNIIFQVRTVIACFQNNNKF